MLAIFCDYVKKLIREILKTVNTLVFPHRRGTSEQYFVLVLRNQYFVMFSFFILSGKGEGGLVDYI